MSIDSREQVQQTNNDKMAGLEIADRGWNVEGPIREGGVVNGGREKVVHKEMEKKTRMVVWGKDLLVSFTSCSCSFRRMG